MAKKAAKTRKVASDEANKIDVTYELFDLPTAFHKAGLAGLLLLIDSLKARRELSAAEAHYTLLPTSATVTFTEAMLRTLMDDLYHASPAEATVRTKWAGATIKREEMVEEEINGKKSRTKRFVYDVVQPSGRCLRDLYPDENGLWLKLWRDMLWNIPRGRPTTREPYNQCAAGESCKEGPNAWASLLKVYKAKARSEYHTSELSSALFPGAQTINAEGVPFEGRTEQNLLLHFWPLVVQIFVPQRVDVDGTTDFAGYTLAVPEVWDLVAFLEQYPLMLNGLKADARGYRPAQAVIDLPAESALSFLDNLAMLTKQSVESGVLRASIRSVEYLHLTKEGNNVKAMASGRVTPNKHLLDGYRDLVHPKDESRRYRNPLFRRGLLTALLDNGLTDTQWFRPFGTMLAAYDSKLFIRPHRRGSDQGEGEKTPPQFANDAAKKLRYESQLHKQLYERIKIMPEAERPPTPLAVIVNRVVRTYLRSRTEDKTGIRLDESKTSDGDVDWKSVKPEFNEAKQKLAESLFLEFRTRKDQAFVNHFAATFFGVTQRLTHTDHLELANALTNAPPNLQGVDRRDDLKTLTLLALSANS